jgi:hypothetical protein
MSIHRPARLNSDGWILLLEGRAVANLRYIGFDQPLYRFEPEDVQIDREDLREAIDSCGRHLTPKMALQNTGDGSVIETEHFFIGMHDGIVAIRDMRPPLPWRQYWILNFQENPGVTSVNLFGCLILVLLPAILVILLFYQFHFELTFLALAAIATLLWGCRWFQTRNDEDALFLFAGAEGTAVVTVLLIFAR